MIACLYIGMGLGLSALDAAKDGATLNWYIGVSTWIIVGLINRRQLR